MDKTQWERMKKGLLYLPSDPTLKQMRSQVQQFLQEYNKLLPSNSAERSKLIHKILGHAGEGCSVYPPFFCDYGVNITVGRHFFANVGCIILDVAPVTIGDDVFLGPNVQILTASHPQNMDLRAKGYGLGAPISINNNVWIGAGAIINPGVTIGAGSVIGSGSVVTHSIPEHVVAAGNPCQVIRSIDENVSEGGDSCATKA